VAAMMWFGKNYKMDVAKLKQEVDQPYSHDNIFHTLLGLMEVKVSVYNQKLDIIGNYQHDY